MAAAILNLGFRQPVRRLNGSFQILKLYFIMEDRKNGSGRRIEKINSFQFNTNDKICPLIIIPGKYGGINYQGHLFFKVSKFHQNTVSRNLISLFENWHLSFIFVGGILIYREYAYIPSIST